MTNCSAVHKLSRRGTEPTTLDTALALPARREPKTHSRPSSARLGLHLSLRYFASLRPRGVLAADNERNDSSWPSHHTSRKKQLSAHSGSFNERVS